MATPTTAATASSIRETYNLLQANVPPTPTLSQKEQELLSLITTEQDLTLSLALLQSHTKTPLPSTASAPAIHAAQELFTTTHARHSLQQRIVTRALTAGPLAAAAHTPAGYSSSSSSSAAVAAVADTETHTRLGAGLAARDAYGMLAATAMAAVQGVRARTDEVEGLGRAKMAENERVVQRMLGMAEQARDEEEGLERVGSEMRERIEEEEKAVKRAKSEWRVMKGLIGGIIVGSGVDWAADQELIEIVAEEDQLE
jgi:hypothetical protein